MTLGLIWEQFTKHGVDHNGVKIAQTADWDREWLANKFNAAVRREIDTIIVTPGIASRPLWTSTMVGQHVGQFKSFAFTATQAVMISGLQQRDAAVLNGVLLSIALGALVYGLQEYLKGREPSDDPGVVMVEAFDRSGLTGWLMDAHNMTERVTRGGIGLSRLTGGPTMSRYQSRNVTDTLMGPNGGLLYGRGAGRRFTGLGRRSALRSAGHAAAGTVSEHVLPSIFV